MWDLPILRWLRRGTGVSIVPGEGYGTGETRNEIGPNVALEGTSGLQMGSGNIQINHFHSDQTFTDTVGSDPSEPRRVPSVPSEATAPRPATPTRRNSGFGKGMKDYSATDITCPTCFFPLDWREAALWRWDDGLKEYVQFVVPDGTSAEERNRMTRGAVVSCPDPGQVYGDTHFIPYEYGLYGKPITVAFISNSGSGKSHFLAALLGEIEQGGLRSSNVQIRPVDYSLHRRSMYLFDELHRWKRVLPSSWSTGVRFVDAFIVTPLHGTERCIFLLDVEGKFRSDNLMAHLAVAGGLILVADANHLQDELGDASASGGTLNVLKASGALARANVAVALTKGDMLPPEHPLAHWLMMPVADPDSQMAARESAEILEYLKSTGMPKWDELHRECSELTLHVVSSYRSTFKLQDSSAPRRVLGPFIAMLAMTGVLGGEDRKLLPSKVSHRASAREGLAEKIMSKLERGWLKSPVWPLATQRSMTASCTSNKRT